MMVKGVNKNLDYWKKNAEDSYMKVPINVLRYISELEKSVERYSTHNNNISLPNDDDISELQLEMDCPTPNELEYTTSGFKSGVMWLKKSIEKQLKR